MKPVDLEEIRSAVECAFEKIERGRFERGILSFSHSEEGSLHELERERESKMRVVLF